MKYLKIGEVDLFRLKQELINIPEHRQYPLQGLTEDDFTSSITTDYNLLNNEEDYTVRLYKNTLEYTYSIIEEYQLYRSRFMSLPHARCYGRHVDNTPRVHVPIESNEDCFFILDNEVVYLPADGSVYWVNTTLSHTFVNATPTVSSFIRVHLIGNTTKVF